MSAFDALPRSAVKLNTLARHLWGDDPRRTIRLAVIERADATLVARAIGVEGGQAVLLDEGEVASQTRQTITLADGRRWDIARPFGCTCKVPSALKGLDPRKV